nr:hypothetical protein [Endozoicomonas sp.]
MDVTKNAATPLINNDQLEKTDRKSSKEATFRLKTVEVFVKSFFESMHPGYIPPGSRLPRSDRTGRPIYIEIKVKHLIERTIAEIIDYAVSKPICKLLQMARNTEFSVAVGLYLMSYLPATVANRINGIPLDSAESIQRIGIHPNYPRDGHYVLTKDVRVKGSWSSVCSHHDPFVGLLDAQNKTISGLPA